MQQLKFVLFILLSFMLGQEVQAKISTRLKSYCVKISVPEGLQQSSQIIVKNYLKSIQNNFIQQVSNQLLDYKIPETNLLQVGFKVTLQNKRVVSLLFNQSIYFQKDAHPETHARTFNFLDDKFLTLADIFKPNFNYLPWLAEKARLSLKKNDGLDYKWVEKGTAPKIENYQNWYFTPEGLFIIFDIYQVAPYSAGLQAVLIPKQVLQENIRPDVFNAVW